jgi:hypothetical protein
MMPLILKLWNIAKDLAKVPGLLESLIAVADAARAGDAAKVRAESERLATLAAYKSSYRV